MRQPELPPLPWQRDSPTHHASGIARGTPVLCIRHRTKIATLLGHLNLGFTNVKIGEQRMDIPLAKAARDQTGIYLS